LALVTPARVAPYFEAIYGPRRADVTVTMIAGKLVAKVVAEGEVSPITS
jgi:hypothetical protein